MPKGHLESYFQDNEISGANWTSDESGTPDQISTGDVMAYDEINKGPAPSMQPPSGGDVPAAGEAIEIGADGGKK